MNKSNNRILLIIPAYNEEKSIYNTYMNVINHNNEHNTNYDVIVINDGSADGTKNVCEINNIPHINLCSNSGIGNAVQTGYKYAVLHNYDITVQFDGDGQHDVSYIDAITKPIIDNKADMVIGSRFINNNSSSFKSSLSRRIGINIISFFIKLLTGKKIYDTTSGFRAINSCLFKKFANSYPSEYPEPVSITSVIKQKYTIKEVPVSMNERKEGVSSINAWKTVYFMINVVFSIIIEAIGGYKNDY